MSILGRTLEAVRKLSSSERKAFARQISRLIRDTGKLEREKVDAAVELLKRVNDDLERAALRAGKGTFTRRAALELKARVQSQLVQFDKDARSLLGDGQEEFAKLGSRYTKDLFVAAGARAPSIALPRELILNATTRTADLISSLSDGQIGRASDIINRGVLGGRTVGEVAADLAREFDKGLSRMETVARTEMLGIYGQAQVAQFDEMEDSLPGLRKQWVAVVDERTRIGHRDAHLQSVPNGEPFRIHRTVRRRGVESLGPIVEMMYPRDPAVDEPGEVINCRCTLIPDLSEVSGDAALSGEELPVQPAPLAGLAAKVAADLRKANFA